MQSTQLTRIMATVMPTRPWATGFDRALVALS